MTKLQKMENLQKLADEIGTLISDKNIVIQDDYFNNIFKDDNGNELFTVRHPRVTNSDDEVKEDMELIIKNLKSGVKNKAQA